MPHRTQHPPAPGVAPAPRRRRPRAVLAPAAAAVLLSTALFAPMVATAPASAATPETTGTPVVDIPVNPAGDVGVRFAAIGDIHNSWGELSEAYDFWGEQGVQAALLVGDLTNTATPAEFAGLDATIAAKSGYGIPAISSMGNHDVSGLDSYDRFTGATGGQKPNSHYTVNGYHVITVSPGEGALDPVTGKPSQAATSSYAYTRSWLHAQLEQATAADPAKPVMVLVHHPLRCTQYVSEEWYGDGLATGCGEQFTSVFDDFPQAVVWGGHIHTPQNIPTSIWQGQTGRAGVLADKGFTSVNAPPLAYYEFESGVVNTSPTSRTNDTTPDDAGDNRQSAVIEITGSKVTIKNYDLLADQWIDQTWTWDIADSIDTTKSYDERFPFNNLHRSSQAAGPVWASGSTLTVGAITGTKAMVSFPQAQPAPNTVGDIVHKYRYTTTDVATGAEVNSFRQWSGFYNLPMPDTRAHEVWNLQPQREYEVTVTPLNAWGAQGEPLTTRFTTAAAVPGEDVPFDPATLAFADLQAKIPAADLLDLGFADGQPIDNSPAARTLQSGADARVEADGALGVDVAVGSERAATAIRTGKWTEQDYARLQDGFTLDATFRLDEIDGGYVDVFGGMQSGGIGLEAVGVSPTSYELQFWYSSPRPTVTLNYGQWYHVTAWYDGTDARLYVDGVRKTEAENVSLNVTPSYQEARYMVIGGDSNTSGGLDDATMTGRIAGVEIYSEPLSDTDVYRVSTRELTALDTAAPLMRVETAPAERATVGEQVAVPPAIAVDNSGRVSWDVRVTDDDGTPVAPAQTDDAGRARAFAPKSAGAYTVEYTATDAAGLKTSATYRVAATDPQNGAPGGAIGGGTGGGSHGNASGGGGTHGELAMTGAGVSTVIIVIAVALLITGGVLVRVRVRSRRASAGNL